MVDVVVLVIAVVALVGVLRRPIISHSLPTPLLKRRFAGNSASPQVNSPRRTWRW